MSGMLYFLKKNLTSLSLVLFIILTFTFMGTEAGSVFRYWSDLVGPTIYGFLPMAVILVSVIFLIVTGKINNRFPSVEELQLIEEGAPVVGLLGTIFALIFGFNKLDFTQSIDTVIPMLIMIINQSLFSTAIGLLLGLLAWFLRKKFVIKGSVGNFKKLSPQGNVQVQRSRL